MQRLIWWIAFTVFIALLLSSLYLSMFTASNPETSAYTVSLLGFWLFANRLIFGFGGIADFARAVSEKPDTDKNKVVEKVSKLTEASGVTDLYKLETKALLLIWKNSLEPFKYTYYLAFFLTFLVSSLFELKIISSITIGPVAKAIMLGAAVPTLLVWGLELLATHYLNQIV